MNIGLPLFGVTVINNSDQIVKITYFGFDDTQDFPEESEEAEALCSLPTGGQMSIGANRLSCWHYGACHCFEGLTLSTIIVFESEKISRES